MNTKLRLAWVSLAALVLGSSFGYDGYWQSAVAKERHNKLTLIELGAEWCLPCKKLAPIVEQEKKIYGDKVDFQSLDADTKDGRNFAKKYKATGVPLIVILDPGGKVLYRHEGLVDEPTLSAAINSAQAELTK